MTINHHWVIALFVLTGTKPVWAGNGSMLPQNSCGSGACNLNVGQIVDSAVSAVQSTRPQSSNKSDQDQFLRSGMRYVNPHVTPRYESIRIGSQVVADPLDLRTSEGFQAFFQTEEFKRGRFLRSLGCADLMTVDCPTLGQIMAKDSQSDSWGVQGLGSCEALAKAGKFKSRSLVVSLGQLYSEVHSCIWKSWDPQICAFVEELEE